MTPLPNKYQPLIKQTLQNPPYQQIGNDVHYQGEDNNIRELTETQNEDETGTDNEQQTDNEQEIHNGTDDEQDQENEAP